ncbi:MobP3 family relaxase [Anaerotruncus rubiinfantis]|uniref:MobP3 family relaxase n=1 Tax=Anaerotruncus rubiinfantis TaxID=1720200 RepID=UPI001897C67C|nr:MobP3 family relaxase [Anaerotruncus rubiinfantis]
MAELNGENTDTDYLERLDQQLEQAKEYSAVDPAPFKLQKYIIQSLGEYVKTLELRGGDPRPQLMQVYDLLEDMISHLQWDNRLNGLYPLMDHLESSLPRLTALQPIRFTHLLMGGDREPNGSAFVFGSLTTVEQVMNTELFAELSRQNPQKSKWATICVTYCCGRSDIPLGVRDADEFDLKIMRKYLKYIATRPQSEKRGSHGLFTAGTNPLALSQVAEEISNHTGNVWLPIFSLRREDAARLGYDNAERWRELLSAFAPRLADAMKIPFSSFRWYASFHNEGHHPHVHMVCYSANPSEGFLTKAGITEIRSQLAGEIFQQDLVSVYQEQTRRREELGAAAREALEGLIEQLQTGVVENDQVGQQLGRLSEKLSHTTGKKQYGYLKAPLKKLVDEIVDELAQIPQVEKAYTLWYELREEVLRTHRDHLPGRLPLSQQKEFKQIKNMVIREAVRLGELSAVFQSEEIPDEPEDGPVPEEKRPIWQQAAQYREAQKILYDETAPPEEKQAALFQLQGLFDEGFSVAAHLLGKAYRDGAGVGADEKTAEWWLCQSAMAGNDYSEYALGKLLEHQERFTEAVDWYQKAAEQNNQYAGYRLAKLLLQGEGVPKDIEEAVRLLTASAKQGNQFSQYTLGKLYLLGKEVERDREAAVYWFTLSAGQGNGYAKYFLEHLDGWRRAAIAQGTGRLLHHLGNLFRPSSPPGPANTPRIADGKLLRKLSEKKQAMGLKSGGNGNGGVQMESP